VQELCIYADSVGISAYTSLLNVKYLYLSGRTVVFPGEFLTTPICNAFPALIHACIRVPDFKDVKRLMSFLKAATHLRCLDIGLIRGMDDFYELVQAVSLAFCCSFFQTRQEDCCCKHGIVRL
jgi:hypothetical protein